MADINYGNDFEKSTLNPLFIVIEGIDGSGKTTQIELLQQRMISQGMATLHTNEPTDNEIGRLIRKVLKGKLKIDPSALAALFVADRMEHILNPVNGMKHLLNAGKSIISSRYYYSNYAFQGEYVSLDWLKECNRKAKEILMPDAVFYINVDPNVCVQRIQKGREEIELYETLEKLSKTHLSYLDIFQNHSEGENIYIIDGHSSIQDIHKEIWSVTRPLLNSVKK